MRRILLTVAYDGTDFCGWQKQIDKRTVQGTLEDAVFNLTGEKAEVTGSGRTDAGVHASGQTADFLTESNIPSDRFAIALSIILPSDVKVLKSEEVPLEFNSRRNAKKKTYRYTVYESRISNPLYERFAVMVDKVDTELMKKGAKYIVGEHDFKCFCATGSTELKSTVRTVYKCDVERDGDFIYFTVTGSGFLYNMVRMIVGALLRVGSGKAEPEDIKKAIETGVRNNLGKTVEAKGLCLKEVEYIKNA